jgi:hypothetical protein
MAYNYDPNTRFAMGPSGYWIPVSSGGRPLSDFVDVINPNGQGSQFIPREMLPADWQPGMSIQQNPDGTFRSSPFMPNAVSPYDYFDYGSNTGTTPQTGLLGPGDTSGGLPPSGPVTQPPTQTAPSGGLPTSPPAGTPPATSPGGGLPVSMPNTSGPVSLPPIGAGSPRDEIERLRLAGLLDNLSLNNPGGVRAADFGNGPGQPMTHDPQQAAMFEWVRNNYFGTWDPRQTRGGSNPYYNAPTNGPTSLLPPMQGPIISGPGLLNP